MRVLPVTIVFALAGTLLVDLQPAAAPHRTPPSVPRPPAVEPETVEVAFVRAGRLVRVERVVRGGVAPELHALRELVQGPTRAERWRGLRTAFPQGARVRSLRADGDLWLVSLSRSALGSGAAETKRTRLWQLAATLAPLGPQRYAAVAAEGRLATTLRVGLRPGPWRAETGEKGYRYSVRGVQLRLWTLGYLDRADVTGSPHYLTEQALVAFQGWEGLGRTGRLNGETQVALFGASRPQPTRPGRGAWIEIHRDPAVVLVVDRGETLRAVHTSVGPTTPSGSFRITRKERLSWSVPFRVWMPYASYFVGGIALHESPDVPAYPASHGCVRLPAGEAERVYEVVDVGTPVHVF
jgi:hypothetical protein